MKWLVFGFILVIAIAIGTGYMGGAKNATSNYNKVMTGK